MIEVVLESTTVTETLEIVHSLRERMSIDTDFQYKFIQGGFDWDTHQQIDHKTIFYFRDPADATWFTLTYL
jgi:hypothetical protein